MTKVTHRKKPQAVRNVGSIQFRISEDDRKILVKNAARDKFPPEEVNKWARWKLLQQN